MAQIPFEIRDKIKKFAEELQQSDIKIKQLFLFGSYANGTYDKWSDIDLAVISDDFCGTRYIDYDRFVNAIRKVDRAIEPIAFIPENFNEADILANEILRTGIRII